MLFGTKTPAVEMRRGVETQARPLCDSLAPFSASEIGKQPHPSVTWAAGLQHQDYLELSLDHCSSQQVYALLYNRVPNFEAADKILGWCVPSSRQDRDSLICGFHDDCWCRREQRSCSFKSFTLSRTLRHDCIARNSYRIVIWIVDLRSKV